MTQATEDKADAILKLGRNRLLAHAALFRHRHPDASPDFHRDIINAWHSPAPRVLTMAFRGGAKSTLAEEVVVIESCFKLFQFAMLLGESRDRAIERLRAIKHELEFNDNVRLLFGNMVGDTWNEDEIVLSNGARIKAFGMEQSMRGVKDIASRPDRLYGDDMESEETVKTPEARQKFAAKFMRVVLPLLDPRARVRVLGTPLDRDAFIVSLSKSRTWVTQRFPIEYKNTSGARTATWPARFSVADIDRIKEEYREVGQLHAFAQEYMLEPEDMTQKKFSSDMITVEPHVKTWQPTMAVYDPARTVNQTSATTGHVVASWVGSKLIIWEGDGRYLMPDAIIDDMFRVQREYHPIMFGVEADGLNEFIMQPLRQAQTNRHELLPVRALKAPKGKIPFIESLQPFFKAHEIVFAKELPKLAQQLLSFPTGDIDAPNALAYFLVMRPGLPIYQGFNHTNVMDGLQPLGGSQMWLVCNADGHFVTAVLIQFIDGGLRVLADWAREGDGEQFGTIYNEARLLAFGPLRVVMGGKHWQQFGNVGLLQAAGRMQVRVTQGGLEAQGREEMRARLKMTAKQLPAVLVDASAHWTLNAFSGGYCRAVLKIGVVSEFAEDGVYKVLCEGLETFAALLQTVRDDGTDEPNYAYSATGVRHLTALPQRGRSVDELKRG